MRGVTMTIWSLSVMTCVGFAIALVLTVPAWRAERPPPIEFGERRGIGRLVPVVQRASALAAAAMVAGWLVLGLGLRLMMRIAAATSPESVQGRLTDADEVVGEVTGSGTAFLVLAVGAFGGMAAVAAWLVVRRWLPRRGALGGAVSVAVGAGLLARPTGLIDPDNHDFVILSPVWLAVVLIATVLVAFGVCFGALADHWAATWPAPALTVRGVASVLPFAVAFGMSALVVVPAIVIAASMAYVAWIRPRVRAPMRLRGLLGRTETAGRSLVQAAAVAALVWVGVSIVQVLAL